MIHQNNYEIAAPESTIAYSLEPYCEMIRIRFVFGPNRNEYSIEVPIQALNNEIYHYGNKVIPFLPSDPTSPQFEMRVELPEAQIPWAEGIRQFEKYLKPPHKNNKRITSSPILPVVVSPSFWFPLYYLTKRFDMQRFCRKLMQINFATSYCIEVLNQIYEIDKQKNDFNEIRDVILRNLSSNLDKLPNHAFKGIDMAPAILQILEINSKNSSNPPSLIEWLITSFPKFAENPTRQSYIHLIYKIVNYIKIVDQQTAFIYWCYSIFYDSMDGESVLRPYLSVFELKNYYRLLFNIPFEHIYWLLHNINVSLNRTEIMQLIIQWIKNTTTDPLFNSHDGNEKNKRYYQCQQLFDFSIENKLLDSQSIQRLDGQELCVLLPFVFFSHFHLLKMVDEFINQIKMVKYNSVINNKIRNMGMLPFQIMIKTFSLIDQPRPNDRTANLYERMRISSKYIDSIFYHWIYQNRRLVVEGRRYVDLDVMIKYLSLPSTQVNLANSPHRRLMIYDVLTCLPPSREVDESKISLFNNDSMKQPFDFDKCLNRLWEKKTLELTTETLFFIRKNIKKSVFKMTLFCQILDKFYPIIPDVKLIEPVNEYSVKICISILNKFKSKISDNRQMDYLIRCIYPMATMVFNTLSIKEIECLASVVTFLNFMNNNFLSLVNEDSVLFYAMMTNPFRSISLNNNNINLNVINNPIFHQEIDLINWSHISIRALIILISYKIGFINNIKFQFNNDDEVTMKLSPISNGYIANDIYCKWKIEQMPRSYNTNLRIIPPKRVYLYLVDFDIDSITEEEENLLHNQFLRMGYDDISRNFVNENTVYFPNDEAVIIYKNINADQREAPPTRIKDFVHSLFQYKDVPIVMNSLFLRQILDECPEEYFQYVGEANCDFEFFKVENPPPDLPPPPQIEIPNFNNNYSYEHSQSNGFNPSNAYSQSGEYNQGSGYNQRNINNQGNAYNQGNGYNQGNVYNQGNTYNQGNVYNQENAYNQGNVYNQGNGFDQIGGYNQNSVFNQGIGYNQNSGFNQGGGFNPVAPVELIQWLEPSQTLLPQKKDLLQFPTYTSYDYYFRSIPLIAKNKLYLRSKIEWKNGRIFACSVNGCPLSVFNFGLSMNLNKIKPEDGNLAQFYYNAAIKQTSDCLLSLLSEAVSGIRPVVKELNAESD